MPNKIRVGIIGFGNLGQFLAHNILANEKVSHLFEIHMIWNRTPEKIEQYFSKELPGSFKKEWVLENLSDFATQFPDVQLLIEVSHPSIIQQYGEQFLAHCDLFVGSPTAFANEALESTLRKVADSNSHACYIPSGALWGAQDIEKMATLGTLKGLTITMKKHPGSLKLEAPLSHKLEGHEQWEEREYVIYEGSVRELCPLAPNNVNTMACAALAGHNLGFDVVQARLVADRRLETHEIEIVVVGPGNNESAFKVTTQRSNPAKAGAVTGAATYVSFLSSLLHAQGRGGGFHFC
jgi:predicted dinucleotide-utilizing enzyme